jgi:regulator of sigma E protease
MAKVNMEVKKYTFFQALPAGMIMAKDKIGQYLGQFKLIFNPKTGAYKGVGGFDSMRKIFPEEWHWQSFWNITAFISLALAVMNLLPIPGLDGGYVMFTLWEMITGRKPNEKFMEIVTTIGLVLLLILMVAVNANDILKYFK